MRNKHSLRLAVLNARKSACASRTDTFAGVAQNLVQQGIPAIIGMQFEISDLAAITFSQELYSAVAGGSPLEAALYEARQAIFINGEGIEWGTPVLYMRAPEGRIFDFQVGSQIGSEQIPAQSEMATNQNVQAIRGKGPQVVKAPSKQALAPVEKTFQALRDPIWQGIGGIVAILACFVALFTISPLQRWWGSFACARYLNGHAHTHAESDSNVNLDTRPNTHADTDIFGNADVDALANVNAIANTNCNAHADSIANVDSTNTASHSSRYWPSGHWLPNCCVGLYRQLRDAVRQRCTGTPLGMGGGLLYFCSRRECRLHDRLECVPLGYERAKVYLPLGGARGVLSCPTSHYKLSEL